MEIDQRRWCKFFHRLGLGLLKECAYPCLGVGGARALIDTEATVGDCISDALMLFIFIAVSAGICLIAGWLTACNE